MNKDKKKRKKKRFDVLKKAKEKRSDIPETKECQMGLDDLVFTYADYLEKCTSNRTNGKFNPSIHDPHFLYLSTYNMMKDVYFEIDDLLEFSMGLHHYIEDKYHSHDTLLACVFATGAANKCIKLHEKAMLKMTNIKDCVYLGMYQVFGTLDIEADSSFNLAYGKVGGILNYKGNAGAYVGNSMFGGTLNIKGEMDAIDHRVFGGEIFQNGKLVYP